MREARWEMKYDPSFDPQYCEVCDDEIRKGEKLCSRCAKWKAENNED